MSHDLAVTTTDSGLRVVTETLAHTRTVALGFFVPVGSMHEADHQRGASHFLEHLCFKGTGARTAREIAHAIESVGGQFNAATSHDSTTFYVMVPDTALERALEILAGIVWSPTLAPAEFELERGVILEELAMYEDMPDEVAGEAFLAQLFPDHPAGLPIGGTPASIEAMAHEAILELHQAHYRPATTVVAAAGNVTHDQLLALLARFDHDAPAMPCPVLGEPVAAASRQLLHRDTEQAHVMLGFHSIPRDDADRRAARVLFEALDGGMSTRLFQELRERRGLCYSMGASHSSIGPYGFVGFSAATTPTKLVETATVGRAVVMETVTHGISDAELADAKAACVGRLLMGSESSMPRMFRAGRRLLNDQPLETVDAEAAALEAITQDDLARVRARLVQGPECLTVLGPVDEAVLESI